MPGGSDHSSRWFEVLSPSSQRRQVAAHEETGGCDSLVRIDVVRGAIGKTQLCILFLAVSASDDVEMLGGNRQAAPEKNEGGQTENGGNN